MSCSLHDLSSSTSLEVQPPNITPLPCLSAHSDMHGSTDNCFICGVGLMSDQVLTEVNPVQTQLPHVEPITILQIFALHFHPPA
jgi:hypothetical protein